MMGILRVDSSGTEHSGKILRLGLFYTEHWPDIACGGERPSEASGKCAKARSCDDWQSALQD